MPFHRKPLIEITLIALAASAVAARQSEAQAPAFRHWNLTASATGISVGSREGWGYGPELSVRYDGRNRWGAGLTLSLPVFGGGAGGAAADLGATWTQQGRRTDLGATAGVTAFLVGDSSELVGGGIGGFAGGHVTQWLTPGLGVTASAKVRVTATGAYPSVSAGLSVRF